MPLHLTPAKKPKNVSRFFKVWAFDCETKDGLHGTDLFCWSLACGQRVISGNDNLNGLFEYLSNPNDGAHKRGQRIIYVHNLDFDGRFIIDHCIRNDIPWIPIKTNGLLALLIPIWRVRFVDSVQFLQTSQEEADIEWETPPELCKFKEANLIFEKPFSSWNPDDEAIVRKRCELDVMGLRFIMKKFRRYMFNISGVDSAKALSLASLAMKAFRINMSTHPIAQIAQKGLMSPFIRKRIKAVGGRGGTTYIIETGYEKFCRRGYYGGITEIYDLNEHGPLFYIDRVSMYSSEMANNRFPMFENMVGIISNPLLIEYYCNAIDSPWEGMVEVEILHIPNDERYPLLPQRRDNKMLFTIETRWKDENDKFPVYTMPEIREALSLGYEFRYISAFLTDKSAMIFEHFIATFFPMKAENDGGIKRAAKIILNSAYGKFGENPIRQTQDWFHFHDEETAMNWLNENETNTLFSVFDGSALYYGAERRSTRHLRPHMNVIIAAYTTAYARIELRRFIRELDAQQINCIYSDTDSVIIPNTDVVKAKLENILGYSIGSRHELGDWDIELRMDEAKFLAPKAYIVSKADREPDEPKYYAKIKGTPLKTIAGLIKNAISISEVEAILREPIEIAERYATFTQSLRSGETLRTREITKQYSFIYNKRRILPDLSTVPWSNDAPTYSDVKEEGLEERRKIASERNERQKRETAKILREGDLLWADGGPLEHLWAKGGLLGEGLGEGEGGKN